MSEEESYFSKRNKFNIALKYSKKENIMSVIIFKCFLEVKMILPIHNNIIHLILGRIH